MAEKELAGDADGHWLAEGVEQVSAGVGDGGADEAGTGERCVRSRFENLDAGIRRGFVGP